MSENISASMVPKVSIVIPIYNVAQFLVECLDSVVNQTLKEIEIICVNDGSTDSSLEIVKRYAAKDDRFVIINKKNAGYGHTMNRGIEKARGKYIGITESDDYIMPRMYEQLYTIAEKHHLDVVKSDYYEFNTISGRKRACPKNCVNAYKEVKYEHGTKKREERKGHHRSVIRSD